jgi:uncharacterized protein YbbC (DUF1343 family)
MHLKKIWLLAFSMLFFSCTKSELPTQKVQTGLDNINEHQHLFKNKRIGIVTNHTAYNSNQKHITSVFIEIEGVTVSALFGPEHGIRGSEEAGAKIDSENDPLRDIPIYSLYGETRKPTVEMLKNIDVLVFDIQDVGARFYTYIYTMALAMEAVGEQEKPFIVLDRPNIINGETVEGNILEKEFATFVGLYPIPVRYGMTVGELATMFNEEGWLANGVKADLTVISLKNWHRKLWYDQTGLKFVKPSPNIPDLNSATIYPGTCLIEGTNASEGRGTESPFQVIGAPWIEPAKLAIQLNALNLPGVVFQDTSFTPVSIAGASLNPKHKDKQCFGVRIRVTDRERFQPYRTGIHIVNTIYQMYPDSLQWRIRHFDRLCGSASVRQAIIEGKEIEELSKAWQTQLNEFLKIRKKYLIYD